MRRIALGLVVLTLAGLVGGCASSAQAAEEEPVVIGVSMPNLSQDYFNRLRASIDEAALAVGATTAVADAGGDAATQLEQVQQLVDKGIDALIIAPASADSTAAPTEYAQQHGVLVVTLDREVLDEAPDAFIATDNADASHRLYHFAEHMVGDRGVIGMIEGQLGTSAQEQRRTGFTEGASENPDMSIAATANSEHWSQQEGFELAKQMLTEHPEITILFGQNDALAIGASNAATALGRMDLVVVGFDGDTVGLVAVRDGVLDGTMTQQSALMGRDAVDAAVRLVRGKHVDVDVLEDAVLTTPDNVAGILANHP
jgi:ribose transport system substrate-binding protein